MECYCVVREKPIRCENAKSQTALVMVIFVFSVLDWNQLAMEANAGEYH